MKRQKPLGLTSRFEAAHLPLPLPRRLMRVFDAIVGITFCVVRDLAQDRSHAGRVTSQFIGNNLKWFFALPAQWYSKESFGGALIAAWLNQDVNHVTVLIHRPPEILLLAVDSNEDFVQVPAVAEAALMALQTTGIARTELRLTPDSNPFIRHGDSAFGEKILDISETQTETMIDPDGIADNPWRDPPLELATRAI